MASLNSNIDKADLTLKAVFKSVTESVILADGEGKLILFNEKAAESAKEVIKKNLEVGKSIFNYIEDENANEFKLKFDKALLGQSIQYHYPYSHPNGTVWAQIFLDPVQEEDVHGVVITIRDVTAFKLVEEKYRLIFDSNPMPMMIVNFPEKNSINVNKAFIEKFGYNSEDFANMSVGQLQSLDINDNFFEIKDILFTKKNFKGEKVVRDKYGRSIICEVIANETSFNGSTIYIVSLNDIGERVAAENEKKAVEEQLLFNKRQLDIIFNTVSDVIFMLSVEDNDQYKFISINNSFLETTGLEETQILGKYAHEVIPPSSWTMVLKNYQKAIETRSEVSWEETSEYPSGTKTGLVTIKPVFDENNVCSRLVGSVHDITSIKQHDIAINKLNDDLKIRAEELAVSNEELERFAYVTSHDLQEPLRMVTSFLQLLQQKYTGQLDETAHRYINFAVEGSQRMKTLILDLLEFSRITAVDEPYNSIDLNDVIKKTIRSFKNIIDESRAVINVDQLPIVVGNESQLAQLFQNLISNALKYRGTQNPVVNISCKYFPNEWQFCVSDNGIGIDATYFEKIFIIFQRLHSKVEYSGTGIGLAICKKIAELHGGKIWVESTVGKGSKFCFSISKNITVTHRKEVSLSDEFVTSKIIRDDK